jgi:glucose/arabinose dehydrogenase
VDTSTARKVLKIRQPYANHNGGMIAFGPDGYLYIGMGDGGSAGDPGNRAQNVDSLLGKMLRINVNGKTSTRGYLIPSSNPYVGRAGRNEIWQRGLRNPWRFSFDRATGDLYIGDVGADHREEIDRLPRGFRGVANFGWDVWEGSARLRPVPPGLTGRVVEPFLEYPHAKKGRCYSVTGGYVYRGTELPALRGRYLYGDLCGGVWSVEVRGGVARDRRAEPFVPPGLLVAFGEGPEGELYVVALNGGVYRVSDA